MLRTFACFHPFLFLGIFPFYQRIYGIFKFPSTHNIEIIVYFNCNRNFIFIDQICYRLKISMRTKLVNYCDSLYREKT